MTKTKRNRSRRPNTGARTHTNTNIDLQRRIHAWENAVHKMSMANTEVALAKQNLPEFFNSAPGMISASPIAPIVATQTRRIRNRAKTQATAGKRGPGRPRKNAQNVTPNVPAVVETVTATKRRPARAAKNGHAHAPN